MTPRSFEPVVVLAVPGGGAGAGAFEVAVAVAVVATMTVAMVAAAAVVVTLVITVVTDMAKGWPLSCGGVGGNRRKQHKMRTTTTAVAEGDRYWQCSGRRCDGICMDMLSCSR